jgi:hypothetical protein
VKAAAIAYALLILVVGLLVTVVMTRETDTEKEEAKAEQEAKAKEPKALPAEITPAEEIAQRVVEIRGGSEFDGAAPKVQVVPQEELTKKLTELDAKPPQEPDLAAGAAILLAQAGALPPDQAEQLVNRRYGGTGILGAYLPEEKTVLIDKELAESDAETAEAVAAGELARALDSTGTEAPRVPPVFRDDEAVRVALSGGVAAFVERQYAEEHLGGEVDVDAARDARRDPETPPAAQTLATFPSTAGEAFIRGAHESGRWEGVDEVLADPPSTTGALLHPDGPEAVPSPDFAVKPELGKQWKRLANGDVGELDTVVLLGAGDDERVAFKAAAGWRAGRFETWVKGKPSQKCPPPCRKKAATIVVHRWGDVADAQTFNRAMREALVERAQATPEGGRGFTMGDGGAALVRAGRFTALVFAPDAPLAGSLAEQALEG